MKPINQIEPVFGMDEADALRDYILSGGWGTEHKKSREFEELIKNQVGSKYALTVNNGTMGLITALMTSKMGECIVPALTMVATINAPIMVGLTPVIVDVDESLCLDIDATLEAINHKTRAIIYVSFNGRCGDIERLKTECEKRKILLIEDACQSFGSIHNGKALGTIGDIGVYSLSPHKIISTGQGGVIVTNNEDLYKLCKRFKDFGRLEGGADTHEYFGINSKFTDFQAVIGIEQIKTIHERIKRKKAIYQFYKDSLDIIGDIEFVTTPSEVTPWMVDIYVDNPQDLRDYLKDNKIETRLMYPPLYSQPYIDQGMFLPSTDTLSKRGLWLPSSVNLTDDQLERICQKIAEYFIINGGN